MKTVLLLLLLLTTGCAIAPLDAPLAPTPTDPPAPDFRLTSLDQQVYQLRTLHGQWVLINFWATWCVPCVAEMPVLQAISDECAGEWVVLGINQQEAEPTVRDFVTEHAIRFPILVNPDAAVLVEYQVIGLPQTVVINPAGQIAYRVFGALDRATFRSVLDDLQAAYIDS
jgi:peroxiredoxin